VLIGALLFGCDGGGDDEDVPPPPKVTRLSFDASDACNANVPTPTTLFRDEEGKSELGVCPGPADPIEKELFFAQLDEGTPLNAEIVIPIEGSLDGASLSSTAAFSLTAGGSGIPPLLMLEFQNTSTSAADYEVISVSASFDDAIRVQPSSALRAGYSYVVVATKAIKDDERPQKSISGAPETALLLGDDPITATGDLDEASAARLERMRLRLAPVVEILANASPPLTAENIVSIQLFSTVPDPRARIEAIFEAYRVAVQQGRYPFEITMVGAGDLPIEDLYPGLPEVAYENLAGYRQGTITVPQFLGDDLRQRDTFPQVVRTIEVPFIITIPRSMAPHGVVLYTPGFGRSKLDARALANEMAGTAGVAVLAIDLRCHGDRSPDENGVCAEGRTQSEVAALTDEEPNNGNMELVGPDGIPDASGQYFFPGDARALRDTQIAAAIEILHVYNALLAGTTFSGARPDTSDLHLVAHGHSAYAALLATAFSTTAPRTVQVPAGGTGPDLILGGPDELLESFVAALPEGIGGDRAGEYVARLEASFLRTVAIETIADRVEERLSVVGQARKILLNHGSRATAVPESARDRLAASIPIPANRISRHPQSCDNFFIFSCILGTDNPTEAREQMVTFVLSDGATVVEP
jgi:hypothetical protein